jgi:hypothetical protein
MISLDSHFLKNEKWFNPASDKTKMSPEAQVVSDNVGVDDNDNNTVAIHEALTITKPDKKTLTDLDLCEFVPCERMRDLLNSGLLEKNFKDKDNWTSYWENEQQMSTRFETAGEVSGSIFGVTIGAGVSVALETLSNSKAVHATIFAHGALETPRVLA